MAITTRPRPSSAPAARSVARGRVDHAHHPAFVEDRDPVRQLDDLVEVLADQQDRRRPCWRRPRARGERTRWRRRRARGSARRRHHARPGRQLAGQHDLLHVAARELADQRAAARGPGCRSAPSAAPPARLACRISRMGPVCGAVAPVRLQDQVLRDRQVRRHAGPHAILGNVGDPPIDRVARGRRTTTFSPAIADRPLGERPQPGDHLRQLALAVPGTPRRSRGSRRRATVSETSLSASMPKSPCDVTPSRSSTGGGAGAGVGSTSGGAGRARRTTSRGRPSGGRAAGRPSRAMSSVVIERPLRRIVVRSAIAKTSGILWEMKMTVLPSATISRTLENSCSISAGVEDGGRLVEDEDARARGRAP